MHLVSVGECDIDPGSSAWGQMVSGAHMSYVLVTRIQISSSSLQLPELSPTEALCVILPDIILSDCTASL